MEFHRVGVVARRNFRWPTSMQAVLTFELWFPGGVPHHPTVPHREKHTLRDLEIAAWKAGILNTRLMYPIRLEEPETSHP